ncbi:bifunctional riboflavin kinase/FMN adenylyltransferase [Nitrosospira lacus]|uniref:Riboflavin biosynthesis protein n=1 Tax=Nitrosospira lacus TaxID=1288494 RepID=A0A1W6SM15_9PROT|nr:bifunctional riboflavin kinase/FAD synthetase [Nitrosospira lacus]ARO86853.1 bifunctional riboflavin kinase/FMN adenylyltransferase [Nitrosospira lacus]
MRVSRGIPVQAEAPVALTIGNFDGVHLGHQAMLVRLKEAASRLHLGACVMIFEPHPREFFAPDQAPTRLTSLREKLELLAAAGVDRVQICRFNFDFARISAEDFIVRILRRGLAVRWILVGDDFRFGARRAGDFAMLKAFSDECGFEVEEMPAYAVDGLRVSSTAVREALADGDLDLVRRLLGRSYGISGRVVSGDRLGKKLGFPTANIQLKHNRPPLSGIFAVEVEVGPQGVTALPSPKSMRAMRGVASLGVRPTVHENGKPVLEVHLFDFAEDIYGRHLRVHFLRKLRNEEKYPDLETLTRQIARDVEQARHYFASVAPAFSAAVEKNRLHRLN